MEYSAESNRMLVEAYVDNFDLRDKKRKNRPKKF